jgi:hypothetical protein
MMLPSDILPAKIMKEKTSTGLLYGLILGRFLRMLFNFSSRRASGWNERDEGM